jgi:tetratricopeptide (TPR) repeat protein
MIALLFLIVAFQNPSPTPADLDDPVEAVKRQLKDLNRPVDERTTIALEAAAILDKKAEIAETPELRRKLSVQAITLLDDFNTANPKHGHEVAVAIQAAVYVWAEGRRQTEDWRLTPKEETLRSRAKESLDAAIGRFERIEPALSGVEPIVAQNALFRLAQARVDRSGIEPKGSEPEKKMLNQALTSLEPPPSEPVVAGFARLLRADIRTRLGEYDTAEREYEAAAALKPQPALDLMLEVRAASLCGERRFSTAVKEIDAAKIDPITQAVIGLRTRLAQRKAISAGQERREADADAFKRAKLLRGSPRFDARLALAELAVGIDAPSTHAEPEEFDILADAALSVGEPARASKLLEKGADNAESNKDLAEAVRLKIKAGAILFQDNEFAKADQIFTRLWHDSKTGASRAKAGMFRVLSRGRGLAAKAQGMTSAAYLEAMNDLVKAFPNDPATSEARWLLGQAEAEAGRYDQAVKHWEAIPEGQPRWISAKLAVAARHQGELDGLAIVNDQHAIKLKYESAREYLMTAIKQVPATAESFSLNLALTRLELTPGTGDPDRALSISSGLAHEAGNAEQHAKARSLHLVAMAEAKRFPEAEREARVEGPTLTDENLLMVARLLDHCANAAASDIHRSRFGRILTQILRDNSARRQEPPPASALAELRLRMIRAMIATDDVDGARRLFSGANTPDVAQLDADGLRDLAEAFIKVDAFAIAIDVERIRLRKLKPGTPPWLEARYGLALALYRGRKAPDARRIIEATEILHPDLGGGELKGKFERLLQRMKE